MKHKISIMYDDIFKQWVVYTYRMGFSGEFLKVNVKHFKTEEEAIRFAQAKKKKYHCPISVYTKFGTLKSTI